MQLHISFQGSNIDLPIAYHHIQQGMIYRSLVSDEEFASCLHDHGYSTQQRKYKLFTYSPFSGIYTIQNKRIVFQDKLSMEIRSIDPYMIHQLEQRLSLGSPLLIAQNSVVIAQNSVTDMQIKQADINVQTIAPVVVYHTFENGHTHFFSPDEPEFIRGIIQNARRKWYCMHGQDVPFDLHVQLLPGTRQRKVPTTFKGTFITGWHCTLHLSGQPEVLDMLYQTGLGAKSSQGFGMLRMLR